MGIETNTKREFEIIGTEKGKRTIRVKMDVVEGFAEKDMEELFFTMKNTFLANDIKLKQLTKQILTLGKAKRKYKTKDLEQFRQNYKAMNHIDKLEAIEAQLKQVQDVREQSKQNLNDLVSTYNKLFDKEEKVVE